VEFFPGKLNSEDATTRSQLEETTIQDWWLDGPPFLCKEENNWPQDFLWMKAKEELRSAHIHFNLAVSINVNKAERPKTVILYKFYLLYYSFFFPNYCYFSR
jgi:hypothetical protein